DPGSLPPCPVLTITPGLGQPPLPFPLSNRCYAPYPSALYQCPLNLRLLSTLPTMHPSCLHIEWPGAWHHSVGCVEEGQPRLTR
ncbi:uncharacterized protein LAESUDRAFT_731189, partial [Laetiporus sulphureus 93-53]